MWPVQGHTPPGRNTAGSLTIRLQPLRYFSTSSKLRRETAALGIIIRCLRALRGQTLLLLSAQASLRVTPYLVSMFEPVFTHTLFLAHRHKHVKRTDAQTRAGCAQRAKSLRETPPPCARARRPEEGGVSADSLKKEEKKKLVAFTRNLENVSAVLVSLYLKTF